MCKWNKYITNWKLRINFANSSVIKNQSFSVQIFKAQISTIRNNRLDFLMEGLALAEKKLIIQLKK